MTDEALAKAEKKREELRASISRRKEQIADAQALITRFEKQLAELDHWISMWHQITGVPEKPTAAEHNEIIQTPARSKRPKNPERGFVVDKSLEIIRAAGRPLTRKALFDALSAHGIQIQGKDPEMVLSTMLWREPERIVRLSKYGYWPKDTPFDEGGYDPLYDDIFGAAAKEPEGKGTDEYDL